MHSFTMLFFPPSAVFIIPWAEGLFGHCMCCKNCWPLTSGGMGAVGRSEGWGRWRKSWDGSLPRSSQNFKAAKFLKQKHPHKMTWKLLFLHIASNLYALIIERSKDVLKVWKLRLIQVSGRFLFHLFPRDLPLLPDVRGTWEILAGLKYWKD